MRISDWSSDVCSSDLGYSSKMFSNDSSSPLEAAPITPGSSRMQASSSNSAPISPPDRMMSPIDTCSMGLASNIRSSNPSNRPQRMIAPGPAESARTRRSEEHTSELPSLMRNSSPV